ncbi:hypothetical protein E2542_SST25229 [Spatholobus suberectus]|nr:hypothetical protein E2542_SST25229 [Spatholobus suberectus]
MLAPPSVRGHKLCYATARGVRKGKKAYGLSQGERFQSFPCWCENCEAMKENTSPAYGATKSRWPQEHVGGRWRQRELSARPIVAVIDGDPSRGGANDRVGGAVLTVRWRKKVDLGQEFCLLVH